MKRLHATALTAALATAASAWGQAPSTPRNDQVMTLTKDGKPVQYKVLKTYKHSSGGTAFEIKDDATGDVLTVIENATPDQIQPTLKPEVVSEVKSDGGQSAPVLSPNVQTGETKSQRKMGAAPTVPAASAKAYTRQPVPAVKRWFGWMPGVKPAVPPAPKLSVPATGSGVIEAAYHPDPMFRLIGCLRDEMLPSMREVAAGELATMARARPEVVDALVEAAAHDPAPTVRLACLRNLEELRVQSPAYQAALHSLQHDRNETVRTEAGIILAHWQP